MSGALVHEWIEPAGGAEKVLDGMAAAFPDADIYALWNDAPLRYPTHTVHESWLSRTALRRHKALAVPVLPSTWRAVRPRSKHDWLLVSSHLFAHHIRFSRPELDIPKLVYAHTPARYIWSPDLDRRGQGLIPRVASAVLRPIDKKRAAEATAIAANSLYVSERIAQTWDREAKVIYPPVDTQAIMAGGKWRDRLNGADQEILASLPQDFVLGASRFIPYKRLDLVMRAAAHMNRPVVIAGRGPEEARLREIAESLGVPAHFVISPSNELLYALYQAAAVYIFPAVEDFGIMPVEAVAAGCPVVVLDDGGAGEAVVEGVSGLAVAEPTPQALAHGASVALSLDRGQVSSAARRFDTSLFVNSIREWVQDAQR